MTFHNPVEEVPAYRGYTSLGSVSDLAVAESVLIGRDPSCGIVLESPNVSRRHALIQPYQGQHMIRDLGSSNGTYVNGQLIEQALAGDVAMGDLVVQRAVTKGHIRAFSVEPNVLVNNTWSNRYTVIEISGLDRPGLLFQPTDVLARLNLNIASAHVATFGERAVDVFYVTDLTGQKITNANRQAAIRRRLLEVFQPKKEAAKEGVAA